MSDKGGLFDSDDEDDVQYNPEPDSDEAPAMADPTPPVTEALPTPTPVPVTTAPPAPTPAAPTQEEEKKEVPAPVPAPAPAKPKPTAGIAVDTMPSAPTFSGEELDEAFSVTDPVHTGHVTYTVKGKDEDGEFEGSRRYNDFYHLRQALATRWPGTYVPGIPAKKAIGNKDDTYIEHRRYFLQRFLRRIGQLPHLLNSDEFKLFARPSGEIEKMLAMMPKQSPLQLVERFKLQLNIDEFPDDFLVKQ